MIKKTIALLTLAALAQLAHADEDSKKTTASTKPEKVSSALELFPAKLYNAKGEEISRDKLKGKTIGIYFSAHWCPPCKKFTPKLVKFRDKNEKDFEVVFVSSDRSEAAQKGYMTEAKMKWLTVKFGSKEVDALKKRYGVKGIPTLVIVHPDGETITKDGRSDVTRKAPTALDEWKKFKKAKVPAA